MLISLVLLALFLVAGNVVFWHFDPKQPRWRRLLKIVVSLAITALSWRYFGRLGVLIWFAIILLPLVYVHAIWLPIHGVNGWTGEPRGKYHALRDWPPPDGVSIAVEQTQGEVVIPFSALRRMPRS